MHALIFLSSLTERIKSLQNHMLDHSVLLSQISEGKLYRLCQKKQVPWHVWHRWIHGQFNRVKLLQKRAVAAHSRQANSSEGNNSTAATTSTTNISTGNAILNWFSQVFGGKKGTNSREEEDIIIDCSPRNEKGISFTQAKRTEFPHLRQ